MKIFQVAKLLRVAVRTVKKWIHEMKLDGFQEASTGEWYIRPVSFKVFCKEHGLCPECGGKAPSGRAVGFDGHIEGICEKCVVARLLELSN